MSEPRILIAGIGNIFLGDDGFGVEMSRRLSQREWPAGVQVRDFGIRGLDLAFALMDGYELAILIDALPRGGQPGALYVLEPDLETLGQGDIQTHNMDPVQVLQIVKAYGGLLDPRRIRVVGCEPADFGPEGVGRMGLSDPVNAALSQAEQAVEKLVYSFIREFTDQLRTIHGEDTPERIKVPK